jgi:hypothetical protein
MIFEELTHETYRAFHRNHKQPSRLEIDRRRLEYNRMNDLNIMALDHHAHDLEIALARRQMLAEARGNGPTFGSRFRQSIGSALISIGERIRPELAQNEPKYNA